MGQNKISLIFVASLMVFLAGCSGSNDSSNEENRLDSSSNSTSLLTVYKSPTCGCCREWIDHLKDTGFETDVINRNNLSGIKSKFGIPNKAQSCHTAIYDDKYFFEGHIPSKLIMQFLESPPENAKGLTVPGMPTGSPGMESGNKFQAYKVWLMKEDGSFEEYASIERYEQQF